MTRTTPTTTAAQATALASLAVLVAALAHWALGVPVPVGAVVAACVPLMLLHTVSRRASSALSRVATLAVGQALTHALFCAATHAVQTNGTVPCVSWSHERLQITVAPASSVVAPLWNVAMIVAHTAAVVVLYAAWTRGHHLLTWCTTMWERYVTPLPHRAPLMHRAHRTSWWFQHTPSAQSTFHSISRRGPPQLVCITNAQ